MSPQVNTSIRTTLTLVFLATASIAPWFNAVHVSAALVAVVGILGGLLALSNLFHVPAAVTSVIRKLYAWAQQVQADVPAPAPADAMKAAKKIAGAAIVLFVLGGLTLEQACTPAATPIVLNSVPGDVVADIACVVGDVLQGSQPNWAAIGANCGALTLAQAAALLQALAQGGGIAVKMGSNIVHVPQIVLSEAQRSRISMLQAELADGGVQ